MLRRAFDWAFRSRIDGRVVVVQTPNVALAIWLASLIGALLLGGNSVVRGVGRIALTWWAVDEIVRGVNPWRRALGAFVLFGILRALAN